MSRTCPNAKYGCTWHGRGLAQHVRHCLISRGHAPRANIEPSGLPSTPATQSEPAAPPFPVWHAPAQQASSAAAPAVAPAAFTLAPPAEWLRVPTIASLTLTATASGTSPAAGTASAASTEGPSSLASYLPVSMYNRPLPPPSQSTPSSRLASRLEPLHSSLLSSFPLGADAASVTASDTALSVHSLPTDLLAYILDFVPIRPRLVLLRRLCKRWNNAVVLSIRTRPDAFVSLRVDRRQPFSAELWPLLWRLRTLSAVEGCTKDTCAQMTNLKSLSIGGPDLGATQELITQNALSLKRLAVNGDNLRPGVMPRGMNAFRFDAAPAPALARTDPWQCPPMPRLRSLTYSFLPPDALTVLAPAFSSLTELSLPALSTVAISVLVALPTMPELRSLGLTLVLSLGLVGTPEDIVLQLLRWMQRHTALTSLALGFNGSVPEDGWTLMAEAPCLTRLSFAIPSLSRAHLATVLAPHTRLCSLRLADAQELPGTDELIRTVGSRLTELQPMFCNSDLAVSLCPRLRSLGILPVHAKELPKWQLPNLRSVTVMRHIPGVSGPGANLSVCDALRLVLDVVRVHTELRTLTIHIGHQSPPIEEFWTTFALLREAFGIASRQGHSLHVIFGIEFNTAASGLLQVCCQLALSFPWIQCTSTQM